MPEGGADRPLRALLIGFGNAGRRLAKILGPERDRYPALAALDARVVGIVTRRHGSAIDPAGIDLAEALEAASGPGGLAALPGGRRDLDGAAAAVEIDYDVLVELTTLGIGTKGEPALGHLRTAIERGRHAVTANKGPLAFAYRSLTAAARERGVLLLHESTVMDGAPVFSLARTSLRGCRVLALEGILNSTTNFVLSRLESGGGTIEEAVREAVKAGFAEADPRLDLEGWDAAAKICVLAAAFMHGDATPLEVEREELSVAVAARARDTSLRGANLRSVARATLRKGAPRLRVGLEEIPRSDPFALVSGSGNILRITTDLMGPLLITQESPGLDDTAFGILSDLMTVQDHVRRSGT